MISGSNSSKEQEQKKREEQSSSAKSKIVIDNYIDKVKPQDGPSVNQKKPAPII